MPQVRMTISGEVQGVGFRYFVRREAQYFGLRGYVQNNDDYTVTVIAQGTKENAEKFLAQIKKGSPFSRIEKIDVHWKDKEEKFDDFMIIR